MSIFHQLAGPVVRAAVNYLGKRSLPDLEGRVVLTGLKEPVEILRDRWGVPHIFANSEADLFFAQGFAHAQDRLWQMELNRRTAKGTLSEVFGKLALDTDRAARTFGFLQLGKVDWTNARSVLQDNLQSYAQGVNAFLASTKRRSVEFTLLGFQPAQWQIEDSLALSRLMIWQLSHGWYHEIVRLRLNQAVGEECAAELGLTYAPERTVTLPNGIDFNLLTEADRLHPTGAPFIEQGQGSNGWVVSGQKSTSGTPYLCNDMHLGLSTPCIWHLQHLEAPDFHVTGATLPGVPMVMVGHNDHIAWGATLAFTDCEDLFVEEFETGDPARYLVQNTGYEAEIRREEIVIKGQAEPHLEEIYTTRHGPIISDAVGYPEKRLALCSMALRPCLSLEGWYSLNKAQNWDHFVAAVRLIDAPQLNLVYADTSGNTGYYVSGKVPIRARGDGSIPVPGWTEEYDWTGEIPFEEMPHALNPSPGFLVTCNNRIVSEDYPYYLGNIWMNGYRADRITQVIESIPKLSLEDMQAMQMDVTCLAGLEFVRLLADFESDDPEVKWVLDSLKNWDGQLTTETVAGTLYEVVRFILIKNILEPCIGKELTQTVLGQGFNPVLYQTHEFYGHDTTALLRLFIKPDSWWISQAGSLESVISSSITQALAWLRKEYGPKTELWQWGKLHSTRFRHSLGIQKPLDQVFNCGPYPVGGDTDTPLQTATNPADPYENNFWGPTFRQIVDLGDLSRSWVIIPPGQSGHVTSPHYADLVQLWLKGEYAPMLWTRAQIESNLEHRQVLSPG